MCRITTFTYLCGHRHTIRRSTCLGNITSPPRQSPMNHIAEPGRALCCGTNPSLRLPIHHLCGPCSRITPEEDLENALREAQTTYPDLEDERRMKAEQEYQRESFLLGRRFPRGFDRVLGAPKTRMGSWRVRVNREGSKLRNEVQPQDVVDDEWDGWRREWAIPRTEEEEEVWQAEDGDQSGSESEGWFPESLPEKIKDGDGADCEVVAPPIEERRSRRITKGERW